MESDGAKGDCRSDACAGMMAGSATGKPTAAGRGVTRAKTAAAAGALHDDMTRDSESAQAM